MRAFILASFLLTGLALPIRAAEPSHDLALATAPAKPTPEQDDATLHDVTLVGDRTAWAVGDRGTIWRSEDGGRSWDFVPVPNSFHHCSFRSVCFLTDRVGWVAGVESRPYVGALNGIVLHTNDGGITWEQISQTRLPALSSIRFFDLEQGLAVGSGTSAEPSGLYESRDGGQTWQAVESSTRTDWRAAAFTAPGEGILVGPRGLRSRFSRGTLQTPPPGSGSLRGFHAASLDREGIGWLAGDGAYLLLTTNGGVSYQPPRGTLTQELGDFATFHAIAHRDSHVWACGMPGSVIWHSSDQGGTWGPQPTGNGVPLRAITFGSQTHGIAVSDLGRIVLTTDGGTTWQSARGSNRRLAALQLHTHRSRFTPPVLVRHGLEDGYRIGVRLLTRRDIGPDARADRGQTARLEQAVATFGGTFVGEAWQLPLTIPGLDRKRDPLVNEWLLLTDRRLSTVVLADLVCQIRAWRPSVIVIDEPAPDDEAGRLLQSAVTQAIRQARDPLHFPQLKEETDLAAWDVPKLFLKRPAGSQGTAAVRMSEILPRLGVTLDAAIAEFAERADYTTPVISPSSIETESFQLVTASSAKLSAQSLFGGLEIPADSPARRPLKKIIDRDFDKLAAQAQHRRQMTRFMESMLDQPTRAAQMIAQLSDITGPLPPGQAARLLAELAQTYVNAGQWSLAEEAYVALIQRYPQEPVAIDAMSWLVQLWTSEELNWQRLRAMPASQQQVTSDSSLVQQAFNQTPASKYGTEKAQTPFRTTESPLVVTSGDVGSVVEAAAIDGSSLTGRAGQKSVMHLTRWQTMAATLFQELENAHPHLFERPQMQFVAAALARRQQLHRRADDIYGRFLSHPSDDPWHLAARGETWLLRPAAVSPKPVVACRKTRIAPVLDGELSDACWANAEEIRLRDPADLKADLFVGASDSQQTGSTEGAPVVMLAHDNEYLYLGITCAYRRDADRTPPEQAGRTHDADLKNFDRVAIVLDIDRDYATSYHFEVDQRGWCRERCWQDTSWNPQWFIAAKAGRNVWRVEAAIPLEALTPNRELAGETWGLGVTRVTPAIGVESWSRTGGEKLDPAGLGFLRFVD